MKTMTKKILSLIMAVAATGSCMGMMAGCSTTTKTPEIEIKIEYEGKTYKLGYTLYRAVAPSTVTHFMTLVENKYYDGVCVHDYDATADKMYTGGYTHVDGGEDGGLVYKNYYEIVKAYKNFTHTVWTDLNKTEALYNLRGEFSSNGFYVGDENNSGAIKEAFGSLSMFYTAKACDDEVAVFNKSANGGKGKMQKDPYEYNSATSLFAINLSDGGSINPDYCTFATLKEESVSVLEKLVELIEDEDDFTTEYTLPIDRDDRFMKEYNSEATYSIPETPIVIQEVKVTKY